MDGRAGLMPKIALANAMVVTALLVVACVALVTRQPELADTIVGAVIGSVLGAGATTLVVQNHINRNNTDNDTDTTPK